MGCDLTLVNISRILRKNLHASFRLMMCHGPISNIVMATRMCNHVYTCVGNMIHVGVAPSVVYSTHDRDTRSRDCVDGMVRV